MELEISKRYASYSVHQITSKLYENIAYHGGMQAITLLANRPNLFTKKLQNLWHFETLTLESTGKPKMWNIDLENG